MMNPEIKTLRRTQRYLLKQEDMLAKRISSLEEYIMNYRKSISKHLNLDILFEKVLTNREAKCLRMRFGFEDGNIHSLEEVAEEFGVTRERIRQFQAKAIKKLKYTFNHINVNE